MTPALIAAIIALIQEAIAQEPQIAAELSAIFSGPQPTPADWQALRAKVLGQSYASFVPASSLPAASPSAETAAVATTTTVQSAPISQTSASAAAAAKPSPYLADGTPNPAYVH
jgi:hypothetical protein